MNNHEIEAQVTALVEAGLLVELQRASALAVLTAVAPPRAVAGFCATDVHYQANVSMEVVLTDEAAAEVLDWVEHDQDATQGVCWDTFTAYFERLVHRQDSMRRQDCMDLPQRHRSWVAAGNHVVLVQRGGKLVCQRRRP